MNPRTLPRSVSVPPRWLPGRPVPPDPGAVQLKSRPAPVLVPAAPQQRPGHPVHTASRPLVPAAATTLLPVAAPSARAPQAQAKAVLVGRATPPHQRGGIRAPAGAPGQRIVQRAALPTTHLNATGTAMVTQRGEPPDHDWGYRQLNMRATSTVSRTYANSMSDGTPQYVDIFKITLLHGWSIEGKTQRRVDALRVSKVAQEALRHRRMSAEDVGKVLDSGEPIQLLERADGGYITLQGVGRLVAMRTWLEREGVTSNFLVEALTFRDQPGAAARLGDISRSYDVPESLASQRLGKAIYAGSAALTAVAAVAGVLAIISKFKR
jgi:hypothetical protein